MVLKPKNWEFLLTKELLKEEILKLNSEIREIQYDLYISKTQTITTEDFLKILPERGEAFLQLISAFSNNYKYLVNVSWGKIGESGDENLIKEAVLRMVSYGFKALEIEREIKGYLVPDKLSDLKDFSKKWYASITDVIIEFYERLEFYFHDNNPPNEKLDFSFEIKTPENILKMTTKSKELNNNPSLLM